MRPGERIKCRSAICSDCHDGMLSEPIYGRNGMAGDDTHDGKSVICDACYITLGVNARDPETMRTGKPADTRHPDDRGAGGVSMRTAVKVGTFCFVFGLMIGGQDAHAATTAGAQAAQSGRSFFLVLGAIAGLVVGWYWVDWLIPERKRKADKARRMAERAHERAERRRNDPDLMDHR